MKAVLFRSKERFTGVPGDVGRIMGSSVRSLISSPRSGSTMDYSGTDMVIYYPSFLYSSNHPLALYDVYDIT